jgi:hypothetical protein
MQFIVDKLLDSAIDTGVATASIPLGRSYQLKKLIDIPTVEQGVVHHFATLDELVDQGPAAEGPSRKLEQGATERPDVEWSRDETFIQITFRRAVRQGTGNIVLVQQVRFGSIAVEAREAKVGDDQPASVPGITLVSEKQDVGWFYVSVAAKDLLGSEIPVVVMGAGFGLLV